MRHIAIPRDVSSDTQRAIQQINLALQQLDIPLLKERSSLSGISEGTSAYFIESDGLYRWTKIRGKLYKEKVAVETPIETETETVSESESTAEVIRQVEYTAGAPRKITVDYTRAANAPRAVSFNSEWYRLTDSEELESLSVDELPTDISFSPSVPSSEAGKHFVTVTFTPPEYEDDDRIIGRVIIEEEE